MGLCEVRNVKPRAHIVFCVWLPSMSRLCCIFIAVNSLIRLLCVALSSCCILSSLLSKWVSKWCAIGFDMPCNEGHKHLAWNWHENFQGVTVFPVHPVEFLFSAFVRHTYKLLYLNCLEQLWWICQPSCKVCYSCCMSMHSSQTGVGTRTLQVQ